MWFYIKNKQRVGPVSEEDISKLISYGAITGKTLVYKKGMKQWIEAQHTELGSRIPKILKVFEEMSENADFSSYQNTHPQKGGFPIWLTIGLIAVILLGGLSAMYYLIIREPRVDSRDIALENRESQDKSEGIDISKSKWAQVEIALKKLQEDENLNHRLMESSMHLKKLEQNGAFVNWEQLRSTLEKDKNWPELKPALEKIAAEEHLDLDLVAFAAANIMLGRGSEVQGISTVMKEVKEAKDKGRSMDKEKIVAALRKIEELASKNNSDANAAKRRVMVIDKKSGTVSVIEIENNALGLFGLASSQESNQNYEEALKFYNEALSLDPEFAQAYFGRGNCYFNLDDVQKAIQDYGRAIEYKQDYAEAYNNRGMAFNLVGDFNRALKDLNIAIGLKGEVASSYYLRAKTYANLGYPADKIIGEYDMAIKFDTSHWAAYTNRGLQYMTAFGDTEKGCADFKRACELGHCEGYQMGVRNGHCK